MAICYMWAAAIFFLRARRSEFPLQRQQLKWLTRGTLLAVVPFTLLYVIPFLMDIAVPSTFQNIVRLALVFLPLTFSWAIVRYRLMDVDLIFKRGVTYTLATATLVGLYFGVVGLIAEIVHTRLANLGKGGLLAALIIAGLTFDPIKRAIQARVDRIFDQKRFDYRETLVDFGRSLNSQTDLRALVDSIVERLPQTLLVTRVAVFLAAETESERTTPVFELVASHGLGIVHSADPDVFRPTLDVSFLDFDSPGANPHLFLENPQQVLRLPDSQRLTAGRLDLNYYLPCRVANRTGPGTRDRRCHRPWPHQRRRLPLVGGYGSARVAGRIHRHRDPERAALPQSRIEDRRVREAEGLQPEHRRVDQHRHLRSRPRGPHRELERADGSAVRASARRGAGRVAEPTFFPAEFVTRFRPPLAGTARRMAHTHFTSSGWRCRRARRASPTSPSLRCSRAATRWSGRIIQIDDITDRLELEAQLTQSEKLSSIGLLAAGVAHEVNTPLAVISSYTQMLSKQLRDEARGLSPVLEKITQQTFRASLRSSTAC